MQFNQPTCASLCDTERNRMGFCRIQGDFCVTGPRNNISNQGPSLPHPSHCSAVQSTEWERNSSQVSYSSSASASSSILSSPPSFLLVRMRTCGKRPRGARWDGQGQSVSLTQRGRREGGRKDGRTRTRTPRGPFSPWPPPPPRRRRTSSKSMTAKDEARGRRRQGI